ncbi:hypothetical protein K1719_046969 [Acacia pycnantha]|nr:hypothetical protein K1719_046969 [Acacia pycnantha]
MGADSVAQVVHPAIQGIFKEESTLFVGEGSMVCQGKLGPTYVSVAARERTTQSRQPRDDSRFVVGFGAGRSGSEAQVVMQVRGERSSPLGHALCTTKRRASEGRNGISYVV